MRFNEIIQNCIYSVQASVLSLAKSSPLNNLPKSSPMTADRAAQQCSNEHTYVIDILRSFNNYVLDVTARLGNVTLESSIFSFICTSIFIASFLVIVGHLLVTLFSAICRTLGILSFVQRMFTIIENEFIAARGLLIIIALLSATLLFSSIMPVMTLKTPFAVYLLFSLITLFLTIILL